MFYLPGYDFMNSKQPVRQAPKDKTASSVEEQFARLESRFQLLQAQVRQAQQLSSLGTVAATIAHEVNNLLTPILSYVQAALGEGDVELKNKALSVTLKNVQMLIAMSDRVLEISAARPPRREAVPVKQMVQDAIDSLCRDLSRDGIRLNVQMDESLTVWADGLQLRQILFNLFLNAREAMIATNSGRLTISDQSKGNQVIIEVHNTGDPIPPDLLPHIFDPLQTSKPINGEGKLRCGGLGLALCSDLIEENAGTIGVISDETRGTTFTLALPAPSTSNA